MVKQAAVLLTGCFLVSSPAYALCEYNGVDNAKTTIAQEFKDSRWVVRARVISGDYHWGGDSWTSYRLKIISRFKGQLPSHIRFFTSRDSGGFYMDGGDGAGPDWDQDYLLFLVPYPRSKDNPAVARGAYWVNYNCGQSKPWPRLTSAEMKELTALQAKH